MKLIPLELMGITSVVCIIQNVSRFFLPWFNVETRAIFPLTRHHTMFYGTSKNARIHVRALKCAKRGLVDNLSYFMTFDISLLFISDALFYDGVNKSTVQI